MQEARKCVRAWRNQFKVFSLGPRCPPLFDASSMMYFLSDILFETRSHVVQATLRLTIYVGLALNL